MSFTFTGGKRMQQRIKRLADKYPDKMLGAVRIEAELIMGDSKANHVPVDLGTLRSSGVVEPPVRKGDDIEVNMVYGGAAAAYALAVHEHPSDSSPPSWEGKTVEFSPEGRGPKYLERPMRAAMEGMAGRIAKRLKPEDVG